MCMSTMEGLCTMPDSITPLTQSEQSFVDQINAAWTRDEVVQRLSEDLQTAVTIELATVPIYLYTYYSLIRNAESGETIGAAQLYANKAGGVIMSVAVEEMLHLSLSSNILFAMGVAPKLYGKTPASYPTGLPYHNPNGQAGPDGATAVRIPLAKLGYEQLWHFLQIEYPEQWDALPQDRDWNTIGQFYSYIRCLLSSKFLTDADFRLGAAASAIQPDNYSPNNVDTIYPSAGFDPWKPAPRAPTPTWADSVQGAASAAVYPDAADSYAGTDPLVAVRSIRDALIAIDTICDQGEGTPIANVGPGPDDDPTGAEQSHYEKFLLLQAQFADYAGTTEQRPAQPPAPTGVIEPTITQEQLIAAGVLIDFADSPIAANYPARYRDIANFSNALFQYMLVMIETIYLVPPADQKLFFNQGLHRSMIWVMDKYFRTIRQLPITQGAYAGTMMAPTFENVSLGEPAVSFAGLSAIGKTAIAAANELIAMINVEDVVYNTETLFGTGPPPRLERDDGDIVGILKNVIHYIGVALTKTGTDGAPMHLPDVGPYWTAAKYRR